MEALINVLHMRNIYDMTFDIYDEKNWHSDNTFIHGLLGRDRHSNIIYHNSGGGVK